MYYGIRLVTGSMPKAGTTNPVHLVLIGIHHRTNKITVNKFRLFKSSLLKTSTYQDIIVRVNNEDGVGDVQAVWLSMDKNYIPCYHTYWYLEHIEVHRYSGKTTFPCYHWVAENERLTLTSNTSEFRIQIYRNCMEQLIIYS